MNNLIVEYNYIANVQFCGKTEIDLEQFDLSKETSETFRDEINELVYERTEQPLENLNEVTNIDIDHFNISFNQDQLNDAINKASKSNYDGLANENKANETIEQIVKEYVKANLWKNLDTISINEFDSCVEKALNNISNTNMLPVLLKEIYRCCDYSIDERLLINNNDNNTQGFWQPSETEQRNGRMARQTRFKGEQLNVKIESDEPTEKERLNAIYDSEELDAIHDLEERPFDFNPFD